MKSIVVISPTYLEVVYKEAVKYDFTIQGYGSFEAGARGLVRTNVSDILGYVYLARSMPTDLEAFKNFLYRCNLYGNKKKFLIAVIDTKGLRDIDYSVYSELNFSYVEISEVVTDVVINRDIFGTILLCNYKPYLFDTDAEVANVDFGDVYRLQYEPIFSTYVLQCLNHVTLLGSFEETLQADAVYGKYVKDSSPLAEVRKFYIRTYFEAGLDNSFLREIVKCSGNPISFGTYQALLELVNTDKAIKGGV